MGRLIAVGAINGDYTALATLIDQIKFSKGDEVVFLGDYVGQEPQSADVLDYLVRLRSYRKAWFLQGDNDAQFFNYLKGAECQPCEAIIESYSGNPVPWEHVEFLWLLKKETKIPSIDLGDIPAPIEYIFSYRPMPVTHNRINIHNQVDGLYAAVLPKTRSGSVEYIQGGPCIA